MELQYVREMSFNRDTKFEVYKQNDGLYTIKYAEYFKDCGWRYICDDVNCTRETVQDMLGEDIFNF